MIRWRIWREKSCRADSFSCVMGLKKTTYISNNHIISLAIGRRWDFPIWWWWWGGGSPRSWSLARSTLGKKVTSKRSAEKDRYRRFFLFFSSLYTVPLFVWISDISWSSVSILRSPMLYSSATSSSSRLWSTQKDLPTNDLPCIIWHEWLRAHSMLIIIS